MNPNPNPVTIDLDRARFVRLAHPRGTVVHARRGTLWITVDGEPEDIEIDAGDSFVFHDDAPALIGALGGDAVAALGQRTAAPRRQNAIAAWWHRHAGASA